MPEPYPFPEMPTTSYITDPRDPGQRPVVLGVQGDIPIIVTPPGWWSNGIMFVLHGNRQLARYALIKLDNGEQGIIGEDGKVVDMEDLVQLVLRLAIGSERYEAYTQTEAFKKLQEKV